MGVKTYFEKSLGKILLYRFERAQLAEVRKWWESGKFEEWENKGPGDCYGAEHLARLLGQYLTFPIRKAKLTGKQSTCQNSQLKPTWTRLQ